MLCQVVVILMEKNTVILQSVCDTGLGRYPQIVRYGSTTIGNPIQLRSPFLASVTMLSASFRSSFALGTVVRIRSW